VIVTPDIVAAVRDSQLVILAVKPFQVSDVLNGFKKELTAGHVIVSVVTGVLLEEIETTIKKKIPVFRAMPNTAIAIRQSMTCISYANANASEVSYVQDLFATLGKVTVIDEKLMDAATVLGACGTAYAMRYIRANIQGGIEIGFDSATANLIAAQTVKGRSRTAAAKRHTPGAGDRQGNHT
jgi:pyrroline-5-carboxylate reductase